MKKLFTLLAFMIMTVAAVAADYTESLYCKGGWAFGTDSFTETENIPLTVTDNGDGTYGFTFGSMTLNTCYGSMKFQDELTITGVTGTTNDSGYTTYSGSLTEGADDFTLTGVSYGDKIYVLIEGKFYYMTGVTLKYGDEITVPDTKEPEVEPSTPEVEGMAVGEDNYQPAGSSFVNETKVDWDSQKLVARIDVSNCTGSDENILSVGSGISNWTADGARFHFYYTRSSKYLTVWYNTTTQSSLYNKVSFTADTLLVELSKENGLVINGQSWNSSNTDFATAYSDFFALSSIQVGSQEGNTRSNATYTYVRVQDLKSTTPEPEEKESVTYTASATSKWLSNEATMDEKTVTVTNNGDGTYNFSVPAVEIIVNGSNSKFATFTMEGVTGTENEDGSVSYSFNGTATTTDVWIGYATEGGSSDVTMEAKSKDNELYMVLDFKILSTYAAVYTFGKEIVAAPDTVTYTANEVVNYNGTDRNLENKVVKIAKTAENTYTVVLKEVAFSSTGIVWGDFKAEGVTGTEDEEGNVNYSFSGNAKFVNVQTEYLDEGDEFPFTMTGSSKDGVLKAKFTTSIENPVTITFGDYTETPEAEATTYTADATSYWTDGSTQEESGTHKDKTVKVTKNSDETYKFAVMEVAYSGGGNAMTLADVIMDGVTVDEDGSFYYVGKPQLENAVNNYAISEDADVTIEGKLTADNLYLKLSCQIYGMYDYTYTFGKEETTPEEPEVEGTKVGEDNYKPAGESFVWNSDIDWDSQKLVASIAVNDCSTSNEHENILSVGSDISDWSASTGARFHMYYTRSTKAITLWYNELGGSDRVQDEKVIDADTLVVEFSKKDGIVINGESWNKVSSDFATTYANFFNLTNVQVGSQEGATRSNATYNYVRVQNLPAAERELVSETSYTDKLVITDSYGNTSTIDPAEVVVRTYNDGTCDVVIKDITVQDTNLGNAVVENLAMTEEDGATAISGTATVSINDYNYNATVSALINNGDLTLTASLVDPEDTSAVLNFEFGSTTDGINAINSANANVEGIYTINGVKVNSLQRGINIVRVNGKTVKVVKK